MTDEGLERAAQRVLREQAEYQERLQALAAEKTRRLRQEGWRRGLLAGFLLDEVQRGILARVRALHAAGQRKVFLLCSRRFGKSHIECVDSLEECIKEAWKVVVYCAPEGRDAVDIARDIIEPMIQDAPEEVRPQYYPNEMAYRFPNRSEIRFRGINGDKADRRRGGKAHKVVLDECGLMDDFDYVVKSVVGPMLLTTGGRMDLVTTPPRTPDHESRGWWEQCEGAGAAITYTLRENGRLTDEQKVEALVDVGEAREHAVKVVAGVEGPKTTDARREYFCEWVTDANTAVLPEWGERPVLVDAEVPKVFDGYVAVDPGYVDMAGAVAGYWDWQRGRLVVTGEMLLSKATTEDIAEGLRVLEGMAWRGRVPASVRRVSDVDLRLIADLQERHGLRFEQVEKQGSREAVARLRAMVQRGEVEVDRRCVKLNAQMKGAVWNAKATDFARQAGGGHYDLVAALKYLVRSLRPNRNPYGVGGDAPAEGWDWRSPVERMRAAEARRAADPLARTAVGRMLRRRGM